MLTEHQQPANEKGESGAPLFLVNWQKMFQFHPTKSFYRSLAGGADAVEAIATIEAIRQ